MYRQVKYRQYDNMRNHHAKIQGMTDEQRALWWEWRGDLSGAEEHLGDSKLKVVLVQTQSLKQGLHTRKKYDVDERDSRGMWLEI